MTRALTNRLRGIFPPLPTPLTPGGNIDDEGLRRLIAHLVEGGVHGLWVLGSGGTYVAHTDDEKRRIVSTVVKEVGGAIPVLAGAGDCSTRKAIQGVELIAEAGADGAFVIPPFYFLHEQSELLNYFEAIAEVAPIPLMLYNNPANTQNGLTIDSIEQLSHVERIVGIKDSTCDLSYFQSLLHRFGTNPLFRVFQGGEFLVATSLLFGAHGAVFGLANVAPRLSVEIYEAARAKEVDRLVSLQERLVSLLEIEDIHGKGNDRSFLGGVQAALELLGVCSRTLPKPFLSFTEAEVARVDSILNKEGLLNLVRPQA